MAKKRHSNVRKFGIALLKWWPVIGAIGVVLGGLLTNWIQVVSSQTKMSEDVSNLSQQLAQYHNETLEQFKALWNRVNGQRQK